MNFVLGWPTRFSDSSPAIICGLKLVGRSNGRGSGGSCFLLETCDGPFNWATVNPGVFCRCITKLFLDKASETTNASVQYILHSNLRFLGLWWLRIRGVKGALFMMSYYVHVYIMWYMGIWHAALTFNASVCIACMTNLRIIMLHNWVLMCVPVYCMYTGYNCDIYWPYH